MLKFHKYTNAIKSIFGDIDCKVSIEETIQKIMHVLRDHLELQLVSITLINHETRRNHTTEELKSCINENTTYKQNMDKVSEFILGTGKSVSIPNNKVSYPIDDNTKIINLDRSHTGYIGYPIRDKHIVTGVIVVCVPIEKASDFQYIDHITSTLSTILSQAVQYRNLAIIDKRNFAAEKLELRNQLRNKNQFSNIIGTSTVISEVITTASHISKTKANIIITGETGCGKELIAKAIHYNSDRSKHNFVRINCNALNPTEFEDELFSNKTNSIIEQANNGTLFLDEIENLSISIQIRLLRLLQDKVLNIPNQPSSMPVDIRVIASTSVELEEEVSKGNFREDLYFRLNIITISLPPLRNRRDDILVLIDHFLDYYNKENNTKLTEISREVVNTLMRYPWPGNVRELENAIERATALATTNNFTLDLLPLQIRMFAQQIRGEDSNDSIEALANKIAEHGIKQFNMHQGNIYNLVINEVEKQLIREALTYNDGVKKRTADFLGINRNTLNKKVKDFKIDS